MSGSTVVGAATSVGQLIGRYFSVVALLPSVLLVGWLELLRAAGAFFGTPSLAEFSMWLDSWSWGRLIALISISYVVGLALHGIQFNATQMLEGYWGTGRLGQALMLSRTLTHRDRALRLAKKVGESKKQLDRSIGLLPQRSSQPAAGRISEMPPQERQVRIDAVLDSEPGTPYLGLWLLNQEAVRESGVYPNPRRYIMPTRLGNSLRRFEREAGRGYGLNAIAVSARLHLVAPEPHQRYLSDAREQLDLNVRLCVVGLIASAVSVFVLATDGAWLFAALIPWLFSYLTYRGAVTSADEYGEVFRAVLDLNRFGLYESLRLVLPRDSKEEREGNLRMSGSLRVTAADGVGYARP